MNSEDCCHLLDTIGHDGGIGWDSFYLLVTTQSGLPSSIKSAASILQRIGRRYCERWAMAFIKTHISGLDDRLENESYDLTNEVGSLLQSCMDFTHSVYVRSGLRHMMDG